MTTEPIEFQGTLVRASVSMLTGAPVTTIVINRAGDHTGLLASYRYKQVQISLPDRRGPDRAKGPIFKRLDEK
jgi:hypothetical protein